jgi:hypothetical protein
MTFPRSGSGPADAGSYAGVPQQSSALSKLSPTIAQPVAPPAFMDIDFHLFPPAYRQHMTLASQGFPTGRRYSEADALRMANTQNTTLPLRVHEYYSAPPTNLPLSEHLNVATVPSWAQSFSAELTNMTQPSPSQPQGSPLAPTEVGSAITPDLLSWTMDHGSPEYDDSPTSPQPENTQRGRSRKGVKQPKDPKATNRLKHQRKSDDEIIEILYEMIVPRDAKVKWKKDRLPTSESQRPYLAE